MASVEIDLSALAEGGATELRLDADDPGSSVVVLRRGDLVYAYRNLCPHAGRFLNWAPGRFLFDQGRLVCAAHGAVFEVDSGTCVDGPCRGSALLPVPVRRLADGRLAIGS